MAQSIRIIIADDHFLIRSGLRLILEREPGCQVVGEASNGDEVWAQCQVLQPDLLILDLSMPGPAPGETVKRLQESLPALKVLVLTAYERQEDIETLLPLGVVGYVFKDEAQETLLEAVRTVTTGGSWFSQRVTAQLVALQQKKAEPPPNPPLTPREHELLTLLAQGLSNGQMAEALFISKWTVRFHLRHLYQKLGVKSRSEAVALAVRADLDQT